MDANREAPVRRRRKVSRNQRDGTPEGSKVGRRARRSDDDDESTAESSATANNGQINRTNSTRSGTLSAHQSKILSRRDRAVANQRSQSQPKIEPTEIQPEKERKSLDFLNFMKNARRSLSSPRNKEGSRNASPNPTSNGARSGKSKSPQPTPDKMSLEKSQLSKLELNLQRFEEERRKFELERRKFEAERRELDRVRLKRLEERDKKRIAEGYQQLLAIRSSNEKSRKASLKTAVVDPEESHRLIESFNEAQEICGAVVAVGEKKLKKGSSKKPKKLLQPPDLVPANTPARRTASLRRRTSPRPQYEHSTSEDADDEYGTERKSSESLLQQGTDSGKEKTKNGSKEKSVEVDASLEKKSRFNWLMKIFRKKDTTMPEESERDKKRKKKIKEKKKLDKAVKVGKWKQFKTRNQKEIVEMQRLWKKCIANIIILAIFCGFGGLIFRFVEGAMENFYKCGVKKVKRDFVDQLEEDWKSMARNKLRTFEEELQNAFDLGMSNYSGQKAWSFLNSCIYCFSVITTIGYGHIAPVTVAGRSITIVYSVIGIPIFLIVLADFGKLFTRGIKFLWAYARGLYYTGSCRKVRKTVPVQGMMRGMDMAYDFMRRPSTYIAGGNEEEDEEDVEKQENKTGNQLEVPEDDITPQTPIPSEIEIDDEFNLPISLALFILISYILLGAGMYSMWETWSFFESFYFVFISMSTIGFGDYVPNHPMFMMASIVYLVFGLALTSMCINVVQLKLSDSFRQASSKIRETIGLADAGSSLNDTPCPPPDGKTDPLTAAIESPQMGKGDGRTPK